MSDHSTASTVNVESFQGSIVPIRICCRDSQLLCVSASLDCESSFLVVEEVLLVVLFVFVVVLLVLVEEVENCEESPPLFAIAAEACSIIGCIAVD